MTRRAMAELPIEDINPECIGLKIEVQDQQGATIGFRLGRYEQTTVDDKPIWRLFSDHPAWSVTLSAGTTLRWVPPPVDPGRQTGHYPQQAVPAPYHPRQAPGQPVTAPQAPAARSPQSWVTQQPPP